MGLTVLDMHRLIEQNVQRLGFFAYKDWESEEVDIQLNVQVDTLVNGILDKHFGRALKVDEKQGFQQNQVTLDNLRKLHKVTTFSGSGLFVDSTTKEASFALPADYYHHIKTVATISYSCWDGTKQITKEEEVETRVAQSQSFYKNHPFYKTGRDSVLAEIIGTGFFMFMDDFNIVKAKHSYIKKPAVIKYAKDNDGNYDPVNSVQTDLDDSLHYMLVEMTSIKIMKLMESNPQKIVSLEQNIS